MLLRGAGPSVQVATPSLATTFLDNSLSPVDRRTFSAMFLRHQMSGCRTCDVRIRLWLFTSTSKPRRNNSLCVSHLQVMKALGTVATQYRRHKKQEELKEHMAKLEAELDVAAADASPGIQLRMSHFVCRTGTGDS